MAKSKDGFKTGIKNAKAAEMQVSVKKLNEERIEKKPVDLVKALGLEKLSSVKE